MSGPILLPTAPRPRRGPWGWLMRLIPEPRVLRVILAIGYGCLITSGVSAFLHPPGSVTQALAGASYTWAAAAVVGAVLGTVAVLIGRWWLERIAIIVLVVAGLIYLVVIVSAQLAEGGNRIPQAGWVAAGVIFIVGRYITIRWSQIEPGR